MTQIDPYTSPESRFHVAVLRAAEVIERGVTVALQPLGISPAQFYILLELNLHEEPMTPKLIGANLLVERTNLTLILDRMERDELVQRARNPRDRRSVLIRLTDHGRDIVLQATAAYSAAMPPILAAASPASLQQITRLLETMFPSVFLTTPRTEPTGRQA